MLCSVFYHLFNCMSSRVHSTLLMLDLCGIGLSIFGCFLYGLHLSFECHHDWRILYEIMIICVIFIAIMYCAHDVQLLKTRSIRIILFVTISLLGLLPSFHWYYLHGGWSSETVQHFFPRIFAFYGILGIGIMTYVTKFPEKFLTGILNQ